MKTRKLVYGFGNNDADYSVAKNEVIGYENGKPIKRRVWGCPYYEVWANMLKRCYYFKWQEKNQTYKGCTVTDEWLSFSNFKKWMEKHNWKGAQIDKDLLIEGNKVYSPDTCVFVTPMVNSFTIDQSASRGKWLIGVCWNKDKSKFQSNCRNPFTRKQEYLGYFDSEKEAHEAWRKRKLELAHELAAIQTDPRIAKALIKRYSKPQG